MSDVKSKLNGLVLAGSRATPSLAEERAVAFVDAHSMEIYRGIVQKLQHLNADLSRQDTLITAQRGEITSQRVDADAQTKALGSIHLHLDNLKLTCQTETQQLGVAFNKGIDNLTATLDDNYRRAAQQQTDLIRVLERYVPPAK